MGQMANVRKSSVSTNCNDKLPSERNSNVHDQPAKLLPTTTFSVFSVTLCGPTPAQRAPGKLPSAPRALSHRLPGASVF